LIIAASLTLAIPTAGRAGIVGHWTFDAVTDTTTADDSGNNRDGTLSAVQGGSLPELISHGISGNALRFNGSNYVRLTNTSGLEFLNGGFSIAAWVRYNGGGNEYFIFSKHSGFWQNGYFLSIGYWWNYLEYANRANFYFNEDSTRVLSPVCPAYNDGRWHFVVGTNDGQTGTLYVDGIAVGSNSGRPVQANGVEMLVGGVFTNQGTFVSGFVGDIDEVAVYDYALSPTEIGAIYIGTEYGVCK